MKRLDIILNKGEDISVEAYIEDSNADEWFYGKKDIKIKKKIYNIEDLYDLLVKNENIATNNIELLDEYIKKQIKDLDIKIKKYQELKYETNFKKNEILKYNGILKYLNEFNIKKVKVCSEDIEYNDDVVYSYHTFILPFRLTKNDSSNNKSYFQKYETSNFLRDILESNEYWILANIDDKKLDNENNYDQIFKSKEEFGELYNTMQYFNRSCLDAIYGFKLDEKDLRIVDNYVFKPDIIRNKANLYIQVGKGNDVVEYMLLLNSIRLKVFNTNIAVMIFEAENHKYAKIEDIKLINEYIRRVTAPHLTKAANPCAFYWAIEFNDRNKVITLDENFYKLFENTNSKDSAIERISLTKIADPIKDLLTYPNKHDDNGANKKITSNIKNLKDENTYLMETVLGDRMFTCSFIKSDEMINKISEEVYDKQHHCSHNKVFMNPKTCESKYAYQVDYDVAKELYSLIYIDPTDSTCQSMDMIQELLSRDLYPRWIDSGTIHAVTHHSLIGISNQSCPDYVINAFLTLYVEMAILVQAQRASIILFQNFATMLTKGLEQENINIKQKTINNLLNLQEKYVSFQNQLLFFEVTPEEQGVEIYNKLARAMYIDEEKKELKEQLDGLYMATNTNQDNNFNKYALLFASITLLIAVLTYFYDTVSNSEKFNDFMKNIFTEYICKYACFFSLFLFILVVAGIIIYVKYRKFKR